jgi:signal transduction histidine kinase
MSVEESREPRMTLVVDAGEPAPLIADRGEMEIILNNLLTNAVKYNRDGGRVDVTLGADGGRIRVEVKDTGIGLSDEECGRLFQEFVRVKNDRTRNILGSGLGLSILRKLARLYGGDCTVQSVPDIGSTFTVELSQEPAPELLGAGDSGTAPAAAPATTGVEHG